MYKALSIGLSSKGHHIWTRSSIGSLQDLQCEDVMEGSREGKRALGGIKYVLGEET